MKIPILFLLVLLLTGCSRQIEIPTRVSIASPTRHSATTTLPVPSSTPTSTRTPPPTRTLAPSRTPLPTATPIPPPAILIGAGDIAYCSQDYLGDDQTADLIADLLIQNPQAVLFTAGDNVQGEGLVWEYRDCFNPTWGRFKDRIHPAPGNHDYMTDGGAPYFSYFGAAAGKPGAGYYSYNLGNWHIVALNSNCDEVACGANSPQAQWLRADLAANRTTCTLLYWHHPRWSSGLAGGYAVVAPFWKIAVEAGVEIVVSGNDHNYERFAPQDAAGQFSATGVRQFVAGTGGTPLRVWGTPQPNSEARNNENWGVLKFTLYPDHYDWEFVPLPGGTFRDAGSGSCH